MKYLLDNKKNIIIKDLDEFDLENTFECGQCFRWSKIDENIYQGIIYDKVVRICHENNDYIVSGLDILEFENIFINYFDLNTDYKKLKKEISLIHENLKKACKYSTGIRILNQDPWEALCSFIISQNNNIPRIKIIIERLCQKFGNKIYDDFYTFPSAEKLASKSLDDLIDIRCGFRDKYILDAAQKIASGEINLENLKSLPINEARKELLKIKGVGTKVAECELLYGLHRLEAFPIDVWMKKALCELFYGFTPEDFGKYAGLAQQYIFHYSRMNSKKLFNSHNSTEN